MSRKTVLISVVAAFGLAGAFAAASGCLQTTLLNLTKERTGNILMAFVNTTNADAGFTLGTWDAWDRTPGPINMQQTTVRAHSASAAATIGCARNAAIATQDLVDRVIATKTDVTDTTFNPDLFDSVVRFTLAASDSSGANLPTAGTAVGVELLLGVDYSCGDEIVFTLVEDPAAPGGFRVDHEVILDQIQNQ
jgi:hypothetical protein